MERCPRCGSRTDQLHPLPVETLAAATEGPGDEAGADAGVCSWCLHEVHEG